jgi:hypothetical protein
MAKAKPRSRSLIHPCSRYLFGARNVLLHAPNVILCCMHAIDRVSAACWMPAFSYSCVLVCVRASACVSVCLFVCGVRLHVFGMRQQPAPVRPTRPAGFTNEPTREITRAAISAALGGIKAAVAATIDENVAPSDTSDTPKASRGVVKPTPKVAVPPVSASINTPKPPLSISRPTAASAAKSAAKADSTPRAAASSSKAAMADAATPAASCTKGTPNSAGAKTAKRSSLGGKTPTVTMTCRCEALDMLEEYGESIERSFQDGNVSLNASQDKSSEVDSSQFSAAANSSGEGNQFGSPAAVGVPQATTLVFSATKLLPDLTGTSVLAARSPKLRTPPHTSGKVKVSTLGDRLLCVGVDECDRWARAHGVALARCHLQRAGLTLGADSPSPLSVCCWITGCSQDAQLCEQAEERVLCGPPQRDSILGLGLK